jgi:hypothetical protein
MMALKLWTLRNGPGGALVMKENGAEPYYFEDKVAAKRMRDNLNGVAPLTPVVVAHGPDHKKAKQ